MRSHVLRERREGEEHDAEAGAEEGMDYAPARGRRSIVGLNPRPG
jgi:hypothetical protein